MDIYDILDKEEDLEVKKYKFIAHCSGVSCNINKKGKASSIGRIKNVPRTKTWCPDCDEALFWEKKAC